MHRESEYGVALHADYKEQEISAKRGRKKSFFGSLISWKGMRIWEKGKAMLDIEDVGSGVPAWVRHLGDIDSTIGEQEFWERLREDFFKNRIFIFTPKGDVVDLPTNSSPIDFAYAIHSDVGDHLVGASVNGKLVSIDTTLNNGDIVEILTKTAAHPTVKWLSIAKTSIAKKHIRNALQKLKL